MVLFVLTFSFVDMVLLHSKKDGRGRNALEVEVEFGRRE